MNHRMWVLVFLVVGVYACPAATYYVATNGNDAFTGLNYWTNAVATISNGVAKATAANDLVLVSNGVYLLKSQVALTNGITVRSYRNGLTDPNNTVVNGNYPDYTNRCFYLSHTGAVLDGFTVTNGWAGAGGGIVVSNGGLVTNCIIVGNIATNGSFSGGGGLWIKYGPAGVYNCIIANNLSTNGNGGGGIFGNNMRGIIKDCQIIGNRSTNGSGGGFYLYYSTCTVDRCTIISNTSASGGAVYIDHGEPIVQNSTIAYNRNLTTSGNGGGGISATGGGSTGLVQILNCQVTHNISAYLGGGGCFFYATIVRNCLFAYNSASSYQGGGARIHNTWSYSNVVFDGCTVVSNNASTCGGFVMNNDVSNFTIVNSIIYSNSPVDSYTADQSNNISYCCTPVSFTNPASGNITNNPRFVDFANGNFRLDKNSACVNSGANQSWMTGTVDLDGHSRIDRFFGVVDMGCYEYLPDGTIFSFR